MPKKISRRQALIGVSSTLLLPVGCARRDPEAQADAEFAHSVASGDPDRTSVVIWTRVSGIDNPIGVDWQVATDRGFANVVADGTVATSSERDYTVKAVAGGLEPGGTYFYRFIAQGVESPIGQTKTLADGHLDRLVIAVASCSNYPFGYFNAYEAIANDAEVDVVAHLGDYIYEYAEDEYGGSTGMQIGRVHEPRHETIFT